MRDRRLSALDAAPTDDYAPVLTHGSYDGPPRDLTQRLPAGVIVSHDLMMLEYYSAADAWASECQAVALGYASEEADFNAQKPRPLLKDFMPLQEQYAEDVRRMRL
jgi:hypothetical protein